MQCPYTPPHEFNIDFPHLMLLYKGSAHGDHNAREARTIAGVDHSLQPAFGGTSMGGEGPNPGVSSSHSNNAPPRAQNIHG